MLLGLDELEDLYELHPWEQQEPLLQELQMDVSANGDRFALRQAGKTSIMRTG